MQMQELNINALWTLNLQTSVNISYHTNSDIYSKVSSSGSHFLKFILFPISFSVDQLLIFFKKYVFYFQDLDTFEDYRPFIL